ncbi:cation-dependent mannose-6-phosphate receptor [Monomorium pharaonis]|uniref:cation-dependent mannose-6-phosphate receptor n=1 Tax=Monomorium pharaonis TaxID=307658 RepID=UPI001746AEEB|nr:cation-dependent mannose-6-phosphate receptor [Monomorium pharaonis]
MKTKLGKMCGHNATLFIVLSLFLILFCDTTSSECMQLASCMCSLPDGHYYNLTSLADAEPLFDNRNNWTVYFHPCTNRPIVIGNDTKTCGGNGVSLCMKNNTEVLNMGTVQETHMKLTENNVLLFEIHHNNTKSTIIIFCNRVDNKTSFTLDTPIPDPKNFSFRLMSPYGCAIQPERGLSTGSVLVILFFISVGVYFIGGIIVLKALRGATGWEMIPNHDFWCKLPSLVRDGVVFTFNCCRADSYERI